ncbi:hypothetical protein Tco_0623728, partial [Tanacetum coccineum]
GWCECVMQAGIGGGVLQPGGGGGEIPIANAAHANYFPAFVVVTVSVASML